MEEHRSSKPRVVGSNPITPANKWGCNSTEEYLSCKQKVRGSNPLSSTVTEPEAAEGLVCETSGSGFNSRRSPQLEATTNGLVTRFENERAALL
jgi:hypothetical protein